MSLTHYGYKKIYATRCDVERVKCKILLLQCAMLAVKRGQKAIGSGVVHSSMFTDLKV